MANRPSERPRAFYGWYITGAGALNNFVLSAITFWGFGIFVHPLREEFGWSSALVAAGFSIRSFQQGFLAPFVGVLIDRFGPRKMVFVGTVFFAAGFFMFAVMNSIWTYFAASMLIALGASIGSFTSFTSVLMRWFVRKRGRAMGMLNSGNGAGYFLVPLLAYAVTHYGWRQALVMCGITALVFGFGSGLMIRDHPAELGLYADGDEGDGPVEAGTPMATVPLTGASVREALHSRAFYMLSIALALSGGAVTAWTVHTIPHLQNVGFSLTGSTYVGVGYAVCQLLFRPTAGVLGDRFGRRPMFVAGFAFLSVGLVVFAFLTPERLWLLPIYYLTFAFGQALWVVMQAATVADYFGARRFATVNGLVNLAQMPVGVLAPIIVGAVFDRTGTYTIAFSALALGPLLSAICLALAPKPAGLANTPAPLAPVVASSTEGAS
ncbi:MAG: MFS transporter [Chloroflexota bacterium]